MKIRVYYEDTDAAGVVYHSNYLNYFERARTEFLRERGFSVYELAQAGTVFPVVKMEVEFKAPAKHDDVLTIITSPVRITGSLFELNQKAIRDNDGTLLVQATIVLACVSDLLRPKRIPKALREVIGSIEPHV